MGVGIGHSGGGITGILCALCAQHALRRQHDPQVVDAAVVSTASGGTIGYLIHQSALSSDEDGPLEFPPPLSCNVTYAQLSSRQIRQSGRIWWGKAIDFLPTNEVGRNRTAPLGSSRRLDDSKGWWQDTINALFSIDYRISAASIGAARGINRHLINAALLEASACPIKRNSSSGCMVGAESALRLLVATASQIAKNIRIRYFSETTILACDESRRLATARRKIIAAISPSAVAACCCRSQGLLPPSRSAWPAALLRAGLTALLLLLVTQAAAQSQ